MDEYDLKPAAPPPLPPRQPVAPHLSPPPPPYGAPLSYATPMPPPMPPGGSLFHQAAKASWVAPLLVVVLGCLLRQAQSDPTTSTPATRMIMPIVSLILIVGGLACGIVALCGVKRYGASGIVAPAIVGLLINGAAIGLVFYTALSVRPRVATRTMAPIPPPPPPPAPITSPQSALRQAGWMGVGGGTSLTLTAAVLPDDHVDVRNLKAIFGRDFSLIAVGVNNRTNTESVSLSPDGATLTFADGTSVRFLNARDVLSTAKSDQMGARVMYGGPFVVAPGAILDGKMVFVPPGLDLSRLKTVTLIVDGKPRVVTGRMFTAEEKTTTMQRSGVIPAPSAP